MSKKKIVSIILLFGIVVVGGYISMRCFDVYNWYSVPTTSMHPTIKRGEIVFASMIPSIDRGDIVVYKPIALNETKDVYMGRIVAKGNDILEIKRGLLYINSTMVDDTNKLAYMFYIHDPNLRDKIPMELWESSLFQVTDSVFVVNFSFSELEKFKFLQSAIRMNDKRPLVEPHFKWPDNNWSIDNFGPIKVPVDHYFIMGDNRENALDSRFRGFIPKDHVLSKVLNKE